MAPGGGPRATVLLCIYRAVGSQYYKYTVGGVNILFVNLMPVVFFVILDNFLLLKIKDRMERDNLPVNPFLGFVASSSRSV
jgi:Ca2+:H+ antiporter